ncbi:MAG: class I SAM-dependent methyltransferase [Planctomycetes bacterium]|nr:class I SAM-dependent methyltransferase [Planctomycetota bacterium]
MQEIKVPEGFDWQMWINRWDRMQERYIDKRSERFEIMVQLVRETQGSISHILDLGCGTGSLMLEMLKAFPDSEVFGIDFDRTLLSLACKRLGSFGNRVHIIFDDLRQPSWLKQISEPIDAVVSATALHWMQQDELTNLYGQFAKVLRSGGIFLNADHVGSDSGKTQKAWQKRKEESHNQGENCETWEDFWADYMTALGLKTTQICQRVLGGWEGGIEDGMPLTWHFDKLKDAGFESVDCFWRYDCDAIYGGLKS